MPAHRSQVSHGISATLKWGLTCLLCGVLGLVMSWQSARAFNIYQDMFLTLSARPLAMGGTGAALSGPESVFYNPAGLAGVRKLTFLYNHSGRHFPGSTEGGSGEWDQLDGDTEAFVVPLPFSTYAHGFTFSGELGYDYTGHPANGRLGYPRERLRGTEDIDAFATSAGLPCAVGIGLRRQFMHFTPADDSTQPEWLRHGEAEMLGWQARIWPGLTYGQCNTRMNYDWWVLADTNASTADVVELGSKLKTKRTGYALRPASWLTLSSDDVTEQHIFSKTDPTGFSDPGFMLIHDGNQELVRRHRGGELQLGALLKWRWGKYDGRETCGAAFNLGGLWLNYTEVKDLLPELVGAGQDFEDLHIYGAEATLF